MPFNFEMTYGGFPFQLTEPEIDQWLMNRFMLDRMTEVSLPQPWTNRSMSALAWPPPPSRPQLGLNEFWYPTGAARWAEGRFLATETNVLSMINAAYSHTNGTTALPLVIRADVSGQPTDIDPTPGITTNMYMLPPRPLLQTDDGRDGLYLVTLVDERYYAHLNHTTVHFDNAEAWSDYFTSLATALGITLTVPTISASYGFPSLDSSLWATGENPAYLMDAAAWAVSCTVVRNFDGTYKLVAHTDTSYNTTRPKINIAGGAFSDALDSQNLIPTLEAVLPAFVQVTFPRYWTDYGYIDTTGTVAKPGRYIPRVSEPYLDVVTKTVAIANSTALDVQNNAISSYNGTGTKTLKSTGKAYFTNFTDTTAVNDTDLQSLAQLLADGYWAYQARGMDECYLGVRGIQPEAAHDILWSVRKDRPLTRVSRKAWNWFPTELQHELQPASSDHDGANAGPAIELIYCNTSTADGSGRYDSYVATKTGPGAGETTTSGEQVWLHASNGEALTSGKYYLARLMTLEDGRKLYDTSVPGASTFHRAYATTTNAVTIATGNQAFFPFATLATDSGSGFALSGNDLDFPTAAG